MPLPVLPPAPLATPESSSSSSKNRFRAGIFDWFQSQLNADSILKLGHHSSRRNNNHQHRRSVGGVPVTKSVSDSVVEGQRTHRIRFLDSEQNKTWHTISLHEYSDDELQNSFYHRDDLKRIFERSSKIVEQIENSDNAVDPRLCTRGLDKLFGERQEACRTLRSKAINAVMDLQEEQWESGQDDFDNLAKVSKEITKEATARALHEARQDVRAARLYLQDVDTSRWAEETKDHPTSTCTPSLSKSILKTRHSTSNLPSMSLLFPERRDNNNGRATRSTHDRGRTLPIRTKSLHRQDGKGSRSIPPVQRERSNGQTRPDPIPGATPVTTTTTTRPEMKIRLQGGDGSMSTFTPALRAKIRVGQQDASETSEHRRNKIAAKLTTPSPDIIEVQQHTDIKRNRAGTNRRVPQRCRSALAPSTIATNNPLRRLSPDSNHSHSDRSFADDDDNDNNTNNDYSVPLQGEKQHLPLRRRRNSGNAITIKVGNTSISQNSDKGNLSEHQCSSSGERQPLPLSRRRSSGNSITMKIGDTSISRNSDQRSVSEHQGSSSAAGSNRPLPTRRKHNSSLLDGDTTVALHDSASHRRALPRRTNSSTATNAGSQAGRRINSSHVRTTTPQVSDEALGLKRERARAPPQRSESATSTSPLVENSLSSHHRRTITPESSNQGDHTKRRQGPPQRSKSEALAAKATAAPTNINSPRMGRPTRRKPSEESPERDRRNALNISATGGTPKPIAFRKRPEVGGRKLAPPQRTKSAIVPAAPTMASPKSASRPRPPPPPTTSPTKVRPRPDGKSREAPSRTKSLPITTLWDQRQKHATLE